MQLATNTESSNGYWPHFRTKLKDFYILHKANLGCVDLTINGAGNKDSDMKLLENCLHKFGFSEMRVLKTGKSASVRIEVPEFKFTGSFSEEMYPIFDRCFSAVRRLLELMDFIEVILRLAKK